MNKSNYLNIFKGFYMGLLSDKAIGRNCHFRIIKKVPAVIKLFSSIYLK